MSTSDGGNIPNALLSGTKNGTTLTVGAVGEDGKNPIGPGTYTVSADKNGDWSGSDQDSMGLVNAKLMDIYGILSGGFDCFVNFNHFYVGNLAPEDQNLNLSLGYLPNSLTYSMLHTNWTLNGTPGTGQLKYIKDASEPKWKGEIPLTPENYGTINFKAKWDKMEVSRIFTKFKVSVVPLGNYTDGTLYAFKTKNYSKSLKFTASILPSGVESQFKDVMFDWTIVQGADKVKLVFDKGDKKHKYCTVVPLGYEKAQVSAAEKDIVVRVSWKITASDPFPIPNPYNTASRDGNFTVRTIAKIKLVAFRNTKFGLGYKEWRLVYGFWDNLDERLPGKIINGLTVSENWPDGSLWDKPLSIKGSQKVINADNLLPVSQTGTGIFWDRIGADIIPPMEDTKRQLISVDHIKNGSHNVTIDGSRPDKVSATDVIANGF